MATYNELCARVKEGDVAALEELFEKCDPSIQKQVGYILDRYQTKSLLDRDDFIQIAHYELYRACMKFDEDAVNTNKSFLAYASLCIQGRLLTEAKSLTRYVHLPVNRVSEYEKLAKMLEGRSYLEQMDAVMREYHTNRKGAKAILSEYQLWWGTGVSAITDIGDTDCDSEDILDRLYTAMLSSLSKRMESVLSTLTPREETVLRLRFGLDDGVERSLEQVGKEFHITRERVRQIEAKAMRKLRHPSRARKLRDYVQ